MERHPKDSEKIRFIGQSLFSSLKNQRFGYICDFLIQHPYALKLDTNQTNAFANSFIPMTSKDWNSLPPIVFPATYITFNLSRPASTDTFDSYPIPKSLFFTIQGSTADYRGCTFLVQLLLVSKSL